jgi:hypothetical protein
MVNLRSGSIIGHLFLPYGKAGEVKIRHCQGSEVTDYGGTRGAVLWAKHSGFCSIGVKNRG